MMGGRFRPGMGLMEGGFMGLGAGFMRHLLRPAVLLLLAEEPSHGYRLMGRLKELGIGKGMDPSLLYRLLRVMDKSGLAESTLDDTGAGPARKVYRLTPQGMELLDMWMSRLDDDLEIVERIRERYHRLERRS
ncbi:MAG: PadR family transcriptional regulator [Actinobacteria bacterium]|nr:PadR family transcriptional regulator [Actinomycetota bacterium]